MNDVVEGALRRVSKWAALLAWAVLVVAPAVFPAPARAADDFLDPESAFRLSVRALDAQHVAMHFEIAPGYYLYRGRLNAELQPAGNLAGELQIPRGKIKFDAALGEEVEYFRDELTMVMPLAMTPTAALRLVVGNQGCADKGLCYPPMRREFDLLPVGGGFKVSAVGAEAVAPVAATTTTTATATPQAATGGFAAALQSRSLLAVAGVFLLAGLLLSFTPCVLPMIPILSAIIVGQRGSVSRSRGFALALAYSLGMALVYTAFGVAAGLMGEGLAAALQNAWVLGAFALLLAGLSLSMFGVYELQMPSALQSRLTQVSGQLEGGRMLGVFAMGGLSALIVGPCVAAPLAGALVYISQTRDVVLGAAALFSLAAGMSVPLLLVGLSAGSLLPRAGGWMERVKHFFGVMLLAVALWMVSPVLPAWALMLGAAALLLGCAVYLGAFQRLAEAVTPRRALTQGIGLMLAVLATLELAGVASGGRELLQPLQHLASAARGAAVTAALPGESPTLTFQPVASIAALDAAVRASGRPVMVDFYADWCVACKELEAQTFSDATVRQRLAGMTLLRVDVTANSADDKALMRRHGLFGPPAMLFFAPAGPEQVDARVIGFEDAPTFRERLDRLGAAAPVRVGQN